MLRWGVRYTRTRVCVFGGPEIQAHSYHVHWSPVSLNSELLVFTAVVIVPVPTSLLFVDPMIVIGTI